MVQINFAQKQVNAKIVYYGPGMSGKTTNLEIIHQRAPKANRGELTSISTDGDRTLFFDFMPLDLGTVAGMRTCFQIYTVPGQVYYNSTRKLVLQGVDGVIFIADSSASMVEENQESMRNLEQNLAEYGRSLDDVALVIQYNKRDLPDALTVEQLEANMNPRSVPAFEGVAHTGQGVFPTLKALAARVIENIHSQQRTALSPSAGAGQRRPTRPAPPAPAEAAAPAASAPRAPLPTAAPAPAPAQEPVAAAPAAQARAAAPTEAAPRPAGSLRLAEPHPGDARSAAPAANQAAAPPAPAAPPARRPRPQEAPAAPARRPAPAKSGGRQQAAPKGKTKAQAKAHAAAVAKRGRKAAPARGASSSAQSSRRTPRPTPVQKGPGRSAVVTAAIVVASIGIGAVLGSLVLGAF